MQESIRTTYIPVQLKLKQRQHRTAEQLKFNGRQDRNNFPLKKQTNGLSESYRRTPFDHTGKDTKERMLL